MIFKRFHRKEPEICSICEQEILFPQEKNFFRKNKKSSKRSFLRKPI